MEVNETGKEEQQTVTNSNVKTSAVGGDLKIITASPLKRPVPLGESRDPNYQTEKNTSLFLNGILVGIMQKGTLVKRKHSLQKNSSSSSSSSSNEEETTESGRQKGRNRLHATKGKKAKERTSPTTSENEDKICDDQAAGSFGGAANATRCGEEETTKNVMKPPVSQESSGPSNTRNAKENEQNLLNMEKSDKLVTSVEEKMNISETRKEKPKRNVYLFDFLGDEVSSDESQALQALSSFWVKTIGRNKDIVKRPPPKDKEEEDFYNKYCDKYGKLSIAAATRLMSLPFVVTVCLKNTAQIEVVVSNRVKALEESEELRQSHFDVVEAMAMHLM